MDTLSFPGEYRDALGSVSITWSVRASMLPGWAGRFEIATTVRGVELSGCDFDGLEPTAKSEEARERLPLTDGGELTDCRLAGDLPCSLVDNGTVHVGTVRFELDLRRDPSTGRTPAQYLSLACSVHGESYSVLDDSFENGLLRLEKALPNGLRLKACITCLYSDYSPGGSGLWGMACHRGAREQYLAVRSKTDYWRVPVTEVVPETYLCPTYQRRVPGTGYRG